MLQDALFLRKAAGCLLSVILSGKDIMQCVCVCVCEREKEREGQRERGRERERGTEKEREGQRERGLSLIHI